MKTFLLLLLAALLLIPGSLQQTFIHYNFSNADAPANYPTLTFSTNLTEDYSKVPGSSEYTKVDAYRVVVTSLKAAGVENSDEVFFIKVAFEDNEASTTLRYLDTETGDLAEAVFTRDDSPSKMINVTATQLGEGIFSINANSKLSCSTLLIRSFHMPADEWFIVQPDQVLHKDLAESSLERWIKKRDGDLAYDDDTISTRVPMFYKDTDHNTIDSLAKSVSTLMKTALLGRPIMIDDRIENRLDELSPESDLHFELVLSPGSAVVPKTDDNGEEEEATISDHEVKPPTKNSDHDSATAAGHDESGSSVISLTFTRHTYSSIRENNPSIGSSSTAISLRFDRRGIWEDLIKFVEKGATDISREVLKITSKIKQLTCKSVDSFVRTSQDFFKYPVRFIVSATKGGFIAVIINSVKEAISAFVDTVYGVIRLVENMMTKVATSMQGIIDFFKFFFSWKDILNTQKVVSYTLTHAPDIITAATSNIYGSINSSLSNLENIALGAINKTFPHVEEKYLDFKAPIVQNQQTNGNKYLMNLIMANQYRVVNAFPDDAYNNTGKPDEAGDQQPPPPPTSEGIAVEAMKEIIDSMKTVNGSVGAYLIKEPDIFKLIKTYGKEAFGDVLRAVISGTFKVADTVLKVSNVLLATTIDFLRWAFHWFLGKTIYIPVISEIWRSLTKSDISINNILALFAAIPTTLLSKTICGKTLIPDSMFGVLTSWTQADFELYLKGNHNAPHTRAFDYLLNAVVPMFQSFINMITDGINKITRIASIVSMPVRRLMRRAVIPLVPANKYTNLIDWITRALNNITPPGGKQNPILQDLLWVNFGVNWAIMAIQLESNIAKFGPEIIPDIGLWATWGNSVNGVVNVIFAIVSGCLFHFDNAYQQTTFDLDMSMKGLSGARSAMDGPNAFFHSPYIWLAQDVLSLVLDSLGLTHAILQVRHYNLNIFRVGNNTIVDSNVI